MVILVASLLAISGDVVIDEIEVVVIAIRIGVDVHLRVAVIIRCGRNLRPVLDDRIGCQRCIDGQYDIDRSRGTRGQRAGQGAGRLGAGQGPSRVVGTDEGHVGRDIIRHLDVAGGNRTLVDHMNGKGDLVPSLDQGILACAQCLVQGEVEWINDEFGFVMVVFVAAIFTITIDIIVNKEQVVVDIIRVGIDIDLRIAVVIRGS